MESSLRYRYPKNACLAMLIFTALGSASAFGADIYRWVDEKGRVHFSDTAPKHSSKPVTQIDSRQFELSPEQRRDAEARTAEAKKRAAEARAAEKEEEKPAETKITAIQAIKKRTASKPTCETLLQRFQQSSECYAPFFNVNGSIKPEAFETCGPGVPYPAQECS